jgi:hypothetical protein
MAGASGPGLSSGVWGIGEYEALEFASSDIRCGFFIAGSGSFLDLTIDLVLPDERLRTASIDSRFRGMADGSRVVGNTGRSFVDFPVYLAI